MCKTLNPTVCVSVQGMKKRGSKSAKGKGGGGGAKKVTQYEIQQRKQDEIKVADDEAA